jgi:hypothetical protein
MVRRVAIALHGAGSSASFARAAFTPDDLGVDSVVALDHRGGVEALVRRLGVAVGDVRGADDVVSIVAGVSLGAHATAIWAATTNAPPDGLLLVMPAWTGAPSAVASATAAAADEVAAFGSEDILRRIAHERPDDWVVAALAHSWPGYGDAELSAALRAAGRSRGPTPDELGAIGCACGVVGLADDPLHPEDVAAAWARHLPVAALRVLPRDLGGAGPSALGGAAAAAMADAMAAGDRQRD